MRKEDLRDTKLSLTLLVMIVPYHYLEAQQDEEVWLGLFLFILLLELSRLLL